MLFDTVDLESLREAARRYEQRVQPAARQGGARQPRTAQVDARVRHLSRGLSRARANVMVAEAEVAATRGTQAETLASLSQERIIGRSDLVDVNYLEFAIAIARGIARVRLPNGSGTGVLVGCGILMTNHHVLPNAATAKASVAWFDYQEDSAGHQLPVQVYALEPERLFVTDPELDFTLVATSGKSASGRPIGDYPWTKLIGTLGKAENGDPVNIIQHPLGGLKQIAFRDNEIIEIPALKADFLYYTADTQPGSSGAPCFNDQWELIALHHQGVPNTENGTVLRKDGKPFQAGRDAPDTIHWIANEGARVSAIVNSVRKQALSPAADALLAAMLDGSPPNPVELARGPSVPEIGRGVGSGETARARTRASVGAGPLAVTIAIEGDVIRAVHVTGGTASAGAGEPSLPGGGPSAGVLQETPARPPAVAMPVAVPVPDGEETTAIDPDWSSRAGYDADFLDERLPLPALSEAQQELTVVVPPDYRKSSRDKYNLHYHHYSLAMHKKRRLAWYSAANIDGERMQKFARGRDRWFIDPRIDDPSNPVFQMGEELYATAKTDRGHLTRFLDVAWGETKAEAVKATNDTFHFTNCALQLAAFNQGKARWQGIEQYLLEHKARKERRRMTVLTGPVFKRNDPVYRNEHMDYAIRIPLQFWKICALIREDGSLAATGFLLGQQDIVELPGFDERFDVGATQVTIEHLERLTGLDFGKFRDHDHFAAGGEPGTLEAHVEEAEIFGKRRRVALLVELEQIVI